MDPRAYQHAAVDDCADRAAMIVNVLYAYARMQYDANLHAWLGSFVTNQVWA